MTPTHADMIALIRGKTNRDRRKLGNNLWGFIRTDGAVAIMLHFTYIVILYPDGTAMVNSGGYHTHTTKKRINQFSPIKVYQKNWEWFFENHVPFTDYSIVSADWVAPAPAPV